MKTDKILPSIGIMAELDVLLDTRLGLLIRDWPQVVPSLLMNGYYDRIVERFPGVPFEEFSRRYALRDKTVLFKSFKTGFCKLAVEFAKGVIENTLGTPHHGKPKLIVNIHPYVLTPEEEEVILKSVVLSTGKFLDVELVNLTYEEITPYWLTNNCAAFCLYRYPDWLEKQFGKYNDLSMSEWVTAPDVTLLAPHTSYVDLKTIDADTVAQMEKAKEFISPFIGFEFIPVENICPSARLPQTNEDKKT